MGDLKIIFGNIGLLFMNSPDLKVWENENKQISALAEIIRC